MSTLQVHAPAQPKIFTLAVIAFRRAAHVLKVYAEVFAEAQRQAEEAERRYPGTGR